MSAGMDAALAIGLCVLYAGGGVTIVRKLMQGKVREGHNDTIAPMFATAGVIYAVLLGFLVVVVWESFDAAKANMQDEATTLTTLYRLTAGMRHPEERVEMRAAIRKYTNDVVDDEWKSLATTGNPRADASIDGTDLYRVRPHAALRIRLDGQRRVSSGALEDYRRS